MDWFTILLWVSCIALTISCVIALFNDRRYAERQDLGDAEINKQHDLESNPWRTLYVSYMKSHWQYVLYLIGLAAGFLFILTYISTVREIPTVPEISMFPGSKPGYLALIAVVIALMTAGAAASLRTYSSSENGPVINWVGRVNVGLILIGLVGFIGEVFKYNTSGQVDFTIDLVARVITAASAVFGILGNTMIGKRLTTTGQAAVIVTIAFFAISFISFLSSNDAEEAKRAKLEADIDSLRLNLANLHGLSRELKTNLRQVDSLTGVSEKGISKFNDYLKGTFAVRFDTFSIKSSKSLKAIFAKVKNNNTQDSGRFTAIKVVNDSLLEYVNNYKTDSDSLKAEATKLTEMKTTLASLPQSVKDQVDTSVKAEVARILKDQTKQIADLLNSHDALVGALADVIANKTDSIHVDVIKQKLEEARIKVVAGNQ